MYIVVLQLLVLHHDQLNLTSYEVMLKQLSSSLHVSVDGSLLDAVKEDLRDAADRVNYLRRLIHPNTIQAINVFYNSFRTYDSLSSSGKFMSVSDG